MRKLLAIAAICALSAFAGDEKSNPAAKKETAKKAASAMKAPPVAPEAKDLHGLVGTWKTTDTFEKVEGISPGGEGSSMQSVTMGPGGYSVIMRLRGMEGPFGRWNGLGVLAWSPDEKVYKMAWVESTAPGLMVETGVKEGEDIVMRGEAKMGGKTFKTRDVISDRTATSYTLTAYADDGSGEHKVMTSKATREEKPAAKPAAKEEKPTK